MSALFIRNVLHGLPILQRMIAGIPEYLQAVAFIRGN